MHDRLAYMAAAAGQTAVDFHAAGQNHANAIIAPSHAPTSSVQHWIRFLPLVCFALTGCGEQTPAPPTHKLLQYIEVSGTCRENHVTTGADYAGVIRINSRLSDGGKSAAGFLWKKIRAADIDVRNYRSFSYRAPSSVMLYQLNPDDLAPAAFTVAGITESEEPGDRAYAATCWLKMDRRLDHSPPSSESVSHLTKGWTVPDNIPPYPPPLGD